MSPDGKVFEAEAPTFESRNTDELVRIGFLLLDYCDVRPPKRPELAREIEKSASALLRECRDRKTLKNNEAISPDLLGSVCF